jgi:hypothetical protein
MPLFAAARKWSSNMPIDQPPLLNTIREARRRLGNLSNAKFYELVKNGTIKTVTIGRRRYATESELHRLVSSLNDMAV